MNILIDGLHIAERPGEHGEPYYELRDWGYMLMGSESLERMQEDLAKERMRRRDWQVMG